MWVRGLKQGICTQTLLQQVSHPMWVRGLKLLRTLEKFDGVRSHPMWVRGLKHAISRNP